jgi:hypothetical protein
MSIITIETRDGVPPGIAAMACPIIEARRISDNCRQRALEILTKSLPAVMETQHAPMRTRFLTEVREGGSGNKMLRSLPTAAIEER